LLQLEAEAARIERECTLGISNLIPNKRCARFGYETAIASSSKELLPPESMPSLRALLPFVIGMRVPFQHQASCQALSATKANQR
jgi:hypothetical protein